MTAILFDPQLLLRVEIEAVLLFDGDRFAGSFRQVLAFFGPKRRIKVEGLVTTDRRNFPDPFFPTVIRIVFLGITIKTEGEKGTVIISDFFPFEGIGRPIVHVTGALAQPTAVNGEESAYRIICHEKKTGPLAELLE